MESKLLVTEIRQKLSPQQLAEVMGTSLVSVHKWEQGTSHPSPAQTRLLWEIHKNLQSGNRVKNKKREQAFLSHGVERHSYANTLFDYLVPKIQLSATPYDNILLRIADAEVFAPDGREKLSQLINAHHLPAVTTSHPPPPGMSAGKNTYTYDAHTYHTKVPPQGIAELISYYLPKGGLVFDPFAGSGMTGVACNIIGCDSLLNELSPAACFIANRFTSSISPELFAAGVQAILAELESLRQQLYTTTCRECGKPTEIIYTIWAYNTVCHHCDQEFQIWDHCRKYGGNVKEHKILSSFPCPHCSDVVKKSKIKRTTAEPVMVVYKCCQTAYQQHPLNPDDLALLAEIEAHPPVDWNYVPRTELPDGVNLRQPRKHGLDSVDKLYTIRNLAAMSHLWQAIHRVEDANLAAFLAFIFTSLYQRVTRLAEFRFWGGSGNMAHFNVPFVFKEANVFDTFARKARSIQDHLQATAARYNGQSIVVNGSATTIDYLPDNSVDMIFTDPPFGANINYSEMNILWEAWLGHFTDPTDEAIINEIQGKGLKEYQYLMTKSLEEAYRVLRPGHWMLLVFMNSSKQVFESLREAIVNSGFEVKQIDIFDKQHATFKQLVSDNTPGSDLIFHCQKPDRSHDSANNPERLHTNVYESLRQFLLSVNLAEFRIDYLHVERKSEFDYRKLYSRWLAHNLSAGLSILDYSDFRDVVQQWLIETSQDDFA